MISLTQDYDEIVLVFDTYRADSIKSATREKRRDGKAPVQYQVRDDTNIKHIPMSRFLSHDNTKADLTGYLASKTPEYNMESPKLIDEGVINALQMLEEEEEVTDGLLSTLAGFVCAAYAPTGITIKMIPELRWHLFTKHMAEIDKLPPTIGALKQHILRVHIQARMWGQAAIAHQDAQLDPLENGYFKDADGLLKPTTTDALPAPKAIVEMVRCRLFFCEMLLQNEELDLHRSLSVPE